MKENALQLLHSLVAHESPTRRATEVVG
jgi:hypothetical protein